MYFSEPTTCLPIDVSLVEQKKSTKYVGDFCIKQLNGWTENPAAVFYQPIKTDPTHSDYFGLFVRDGKLLICDASSTFTDSINAIVANDGEIVFSRYRHDYAESKDMSVWIDGGRDYLRCSHPSTIIKIQMIDGNFIILPEETHAEA